MPDDDKLTPAAREDVANSISFALLWSRGRKRVHDSEAMTAALAADRIVQHLERSGFVILKRPPIGGSVPLNPPANYPHTRPEDLK